MNRQHLPRPARGTRLARTLCSIRVLPLSALLFNVPTCKPLNVLTSPILPRAHSHFGSHLFLISEKTSPFFSYTCVEPILQPFCFHIHACNGGCTPSPSRQPSNLLTLQPVSGLSPSFSHSCALFCTFLHSRKTQLFSFQAIPHSLRKTPGVGVGAAVVFLKKNFRCLGIPTDARHLFSAQTAQRASVISGSVLTPSSLTTDNRKVITTSKKSGAMAVVGRGGDAHAAKLILVIFFVEDVPLLAAFQDFFLLRSDFLAHFQFNLLFFFQCGGQNLHDLLSNGVAVVDEFHFFAFDQHFRYLVREPYDFFAGEAHLPFPCLNIASPNPGSSHPSHSPISIFRFLPQDQLAVSRQLLLHLLVHLLIRDARPPHLVLVIDQDLPAFDQAFHNLVRHVRYKVPYEKHLSEFPLHKRKRVSLLAAPIKCKETRGFARKSLTVGAQHAAHLLGNQCEY